MTRSSENQEKKNPMNNGSEQPSANEALGWEGHVHFPDGAPLWSRILSHWPELRTGFAFSLVFAAGAIIGGSFAALVACNRNKSQKTAS